MVAPWVADGTGLLAAASVLALISADLSGPHWMANGPDMAVHQYVVAHITTAQMMWWNSVGSNFPYEICLAGGAISLVAAGLKQNKGKALRAAVLAQIAFSSCAASVSMSEPPLSFAFKAFFQRARPSNMLHNSFSFPSGHCTATAFLAGLLLWVLLPLALDPDVGQSEPLNENLLKASTNGTTPAGSSDQSEPPNKNLHKFGPGVQMATFGGLMAFTATGRMLADVHWLSDTMAGTCLGFIVASGLTITLGSVETAWAANFPSKGREKKESDAVGTRVSPVIKPRTAGSDKSSEIRDAASSEEAKSKQ